MATEDHERQKERVDLIREVFSYIQKFMDRVFVIKIDYAVIDSDLMTGLVKDLALLHRNDIGVVIVSGAKERIDEVLTAWAIRTETVDNVRITPPEAMPLIRMAAFDAANRVMTLLSAQDEQAVIGNWVRARSMGVSGGRDYLQTGVVDRIRIDMLRKVIEDGLIPILPCIGWNALGDPYNISSDELATTLAVRLQAEKLFFVTRSRDIFSGLELPERVSVDRGSAQSDRTAQEPDRTPAPVSRLTMNEADEITKLNAGKRSHEGLTLLSQALSACKGGVCRVHIVDGSLDGVLLTEIFSSSGSGTMVYANQYESIRDMRPEDVPDVLRIMRPYIEKGFLVTRTEQSLESAYREFVVYEIDGTVHGCAALHPYPDGQGEIAGLAVDGSLAYMGMGNRLVSYLVDRARNTGLSRVFALTTQAYDWFLQMGFRPADPSALPPEKMQSYNRARNSRVLVYPLS